MGTVHIRSKGASNVYPQRIFHDEVIDKPWLLSRFWVYCKLYHSLVTFHCLTQNEAEPSLGQTVKGHQIMI